MQKSGMFGILEYSEPFHNCILIHIQNSKNKPYITLEIQNPGIFKTRHMFQTFSEILDGVFCKNF